MVGYSPFGQGRLPESPALDSLAEARHATPAQVILAFLTRDAGVFTIPKSSGMERPRQNVQAMNLKVSEEDVRKVEKAFPARRRSGLPML